MVDLGASQLMYYCLLSHEPIRKIAHHVAACLATEDQGDNRILGSTVPEVVFFHCCLNLLEEIPQSDYTQGKNDKGINIKKGDRGDHFRLTLYQSGFSQDRINRPDKMYTGVQMIKIVLRLDGQL